MNNSSSAVSFPAGVCFHNPSALKLQQSRRSMAVAAAPGEGSRPVLGTRHCHGGNVSHAQVNAHPHPGNPHDHGKVPFAVTGPQHWSALHLKTQVFCIKHLEQISLSTSQFLQDMGRSSCHFLYSSKAFLKIKEKSKNQSYITLFKRLKNGCKKDLTGCITLQEFLLRYI